MWQSKRICQVGKSMMAAETLALVHAAEASFWLSKLFIELCSTTDKSLMLPLNCYIDSKCFIFNPSNIRQKIKSRNRNTLWNARKERNQQNGFLVKSSLLTALQKGELHVIHY